MCPFPAPRPPRGASRRRQHVIALGFRRSDQLLHLCQRRRTGRRAGGPRGGGPIGGVGRDQAPFDGKSERRLKDRVVLVNGRTRQAFFLERVVEGALRLSLGPSEIAGNLGGPCRFRGPQRPGAASGPRPPRACSPHRPSSGSFGQPVVVQRFRGSDHSKKSLLDGAPGAGLEPASIRIQSPAFFQLNYPGPATGSPYRRPNRSSHINPTAFSVRTRFPGHPATEAVASSDMPGPAVTGRLERWT